MFRIEKKIYSKLKISFLFWLFLGGCENDSKQGESKEKVWKGTSQEFKTQFEKITESDTSSVLLDQKSKQKYDGIIETNNTSVTTSQKYRDGKLNGMSSHVSKDGSRVEAFYKDGVLHGDMILYDSKGNVRSVISYENGEVKLR